MAVQAQYPSNILLLNNNNRNGQEGHEYSLQQQQQQPSGALGLSLLDHSHNILCNTSTNSRKRGREGTSPNVINHFSLQSQPSQIIHLSQLHNHHHQHQQQQQNVVSTGLRLSFDDHQQQQQQQRLQLQLHQHQQSQQQQQQQQGCHSSSFSSLLPQGLISQMKQQHDELDQYLQTQGENLRRTLAEKRQKHYRELLNAAEEAVAHRLREKEVEFAKATRRNAELEARTAQLTMEAQVWQAKARAQEAAAASLQAQLQQTIMCEDAGGGGVSCGVEGQAEDAESAYIDPDRVVEVGAARGKCRGCEKRVATVVVLPCRHLCVCTECDAHFRVCPVCFTPKNSTVEVFLS